MNRSVEAHALLQKKGFQVASFGTSATMKLPGPAADRPNVFPFTLSYAEIYETLRRQDFELYTSNGVLSMLERNMRVKERPERWQARSADFQVVVTFELRVFEAVIEDLDSRPAAGGSGDPVHVFNITVKDTHEDATLGAINALKLVQLVSLPHSSHLFPLD
jgi:RNA polymerase II subunit A C-terminal domain phosphatase SSU72